MTRSFLIGAKLRATYVRLEFTAILLNMKEETESLVIVIISESQRF